MQSASQHPLFKRRQQGLQKPVKRQLDAPGSATMGWPGRRNDAEHLYRTAAHFAAEYTAPSPSGAFSINA